ncbi:type II secretion system F family protein [Nocardioides sp.]|uniref:type II secretion system F family protein n=1 Tax=Nocardioides sp. TaxID=35761 RepID=UPI0039E45F61
MITLAVVSAALAVTLSVAPRPRLGPPRRRPPGWVFAMPGVLLVVAVPTRVMALLALGVGVTVAAVRLWRRRTARLAASGTAATLVEVCEQLAAELSAGQPPDAALTSAARSWPVLAPVAEAARVGADVPAALRLVAALPGAGELRWVAAAWQVAHRTGQGLAAAIDRVALDLREQQASRRVVDGELASARATGKLVALLPVAALAMGSGVGGDPWAFLLGTTVGVVALALGLALALAGLWWIEAIARSVDSP